MKLFGSVTSPFARKVRIVAAELGEPVEWVNTATEAGSAEHVAIAPIRRVPVAVLDGRTIFDSRAIIDWLIATRGHGPLTPPRDAWHERNVLSAIDATMESLIQVLYLIREGVTAPAFAKRQRDRTESILGWLADKLSADHFGLPEVAAICALDWIDFRQLYPTGTALAAVRAAWRDRPSVATTLPHEH